MRPRKVTPAIERFRAKLEVDANGCWLWQAATAGAGYGVFFISRNARQRQVYAHRWSYEHHKGPIPDGLVIDHLCRVTRCVNPEHLEAVTQRENVYRGGSPVARKRLQTHCIHGHEFTPENTVIARSGRRSCRTCKNLRQRVAWKRGQVA